MNFDISYDLKLEIVNAVKKRNEMFARWIDLCSKIAFLLVLIAALINATSLKEYMFSDREYLLDVVTIFTVLLSICFDFVFRSETYKENLSVMNNLQKISLQQSAFENAFMENVHLVKEIDVARARHDICMRLKAQHRLCTQCEKDKLQPVDIITMKRQRYIISVLIIEVILLLGMLVFLNTVPLLMYIIPSVMLIIGLLFMLLDAVGGKKAEKQVEKIYETIGGEQ